MLQPKTLRRITLIALLLITIAAVLFVFLRTKSVLPTPSTDIDYKSRLELEKRAQAGDPAAQYELTLYLNNQGESAMLLKRSAEAGYPPAVLTYATSLMGENQKDGHLARKMLEGVACAGYYPAIIELTRCISLGECGPPSLQIALTWSIVSRILDERKLIKSNVLRDDEIRFRESLNPEEIGLAENEAKLFARNIQKVTE